MRRFLTGVATLFCLLLVVTPVQARSGCCSWHGGVSGCDTSVGRQVCNDGTYSPSCTCAYYPPPPPPPKAECSSAKMTITYSRNLQNTCNQDVGLTWDGCTNTSKYSLSLSKYAGSDPGPLADSVKASYRFENIIPGKWYFNLKPGDSNGWGKIWYWSVNVPEVTPELFGSVDNVSKTISYSTLCVKSVSILPKITNSLDPQSGVINLSTTSASSYTLTATDFKNNKITKQLEYRPVLDKVVGLSAGMKPEATPSGRPLTDTDKLLLGAGGAIVVMLAYSAIKSWGKRPIS